MLSLDDIFNIAKDNFDKELYWRKKELADLKSELESLKDKENEELSFLKRGAIALSYAHLEGGTKNLFIIYIEFLNNLLSSKFLSLEKENIDEVILDLLFYEKLKIFSQNTKNKRLKGLNQCKDFFLGNKILKIDKNIINTKSNLNFKTLKNIYELTDIDIISIEIERKFIDKLVTRRNAIAHGENSSDEISIVIDGIDKVLKLLDLIKQDIENKIFSFKEINCN